MCDRYMFLGIFYMGKIQQIAFALSFISILISSVAAVFMKTGISEMLGVLTFLLLAVGTIVGLIQDV